MAMPAGRGGADSTDGPDPRAGIKDQMVFHVKNAVETRFGARKKQEFDTTVKNVIAEQADNCNYVAPAAMAIDSGPAPAAVFRIPEPTRRDEPEEDDTHSDDNSTPDGPSQEAQVLVKSLCEGCKQAQPSRVALSNFVRAAQGLDVSDVCGALDERLEEKQHWQIRLRALCCVEALLGTPDVVEYYTKHPDGVTRNQGVVQDSVKVKAKKILKQLGIEEPNKHVTDPLPPTGTTGAAGEEVADGSEADMLEGLAIKTGTKGKSGDTGRLKKRKPRGSTLTSPPPTPPSGAPDLTTQSASPVATPQGTPVAPATPPVVGPATVDPLDFIFGSPVVATPPAGAPKPPPGAQPASDPLLDLFS